MVPECSSTVNVLLLTEEHRLRARKGVGLLWKIFVFRREKQSNEYKIKLTRRYVIFALIRYAATEIKMHKKILSEKRREGCRKKSHIMEAINKSCPHTCIDKQK
jgi:hypothetical protein